MNYRGTKARACVCARAHARSDVDDRAVYFAKCFLNRLVIYFKAYKRRVREKQLNSFFVSFDATHGRRKKSL